MWRESLRGVALMALVALAACQDRDKNKDTPDNPPPAPHSAQPSDATWTPGDENWPPRAATLMLPEGGPASPSPKAIVQAWRANLGWNKKAPDAGYAGANFGIGGWVGYWDELSSHPAHDAGALQSFTPSCGAPFVIEAGAAQQVEDCDSAPAKYDTLCDSAYEKVRGSCAKTCSKLMPACGHSHVGPHVYMEWGCLEEKESSAVQPVPHEICQRWEYCTCTATK